MVSSNNGIIVEKEAVLCFVKGCWAYFTTCALDQQWGDDWNDAPYEYNAGTPYQWRESYLKRGVEPYNVFKIAFEAPWLVGPDDGFLNSPYSVEMINKGAAPWLHTEKWADFHYAIPAGTNLVDFIEMIHKGGGTVYLPLT